jgi:hypothetical protein
LLLKTLISIELHDFLPIRCAAVENEESSIAS